MKNSLRAISYTIFHFMIFLACGDSVENERFIALWAAMIMAVIFIANRPTFKEWKLSCSRRTFFYFVGAVFFLVIGFSNRVEAIDSWQDINLFILYFKLVGVLLYIKWIIGCSLKSKYKYNNKLINDYKMSFIGKL